MNKVKREVRKRERESFDKSSNMNKVKREVRKRERERALTRINLLA
jgi:hypothetical protein